MKRIDNIGNLPKPLQIFARALGGIMSGTQLEEFYEMSNVSEFEKKAIELEYEITKPAVDEKTDRGYLVGFSVDEPKNIVTMTSYATLKIYFVEATASEVREWTRKINSHRELQEEDMRLRQGKIKQLNKPVTIIGA